MSRADNRPVSDGRSPDARLELIDWTPGSLVPMPLIRTGPPNIYSTSRWRRVRFDGPRQAMQANPPVGTWRRVYHSIAPPGGHAAMVDQRRRQAGRTGSVGTRKPVNLVGYTRR